MANCFDNIIGFTQTTCPCFTGDFNDDAKKSTSGLFMDELPESEHLLKGFKTTADCGKGLQDLFVSARKSAIDQFYEKLLQEVGIRYKVLQDPFIGLVGQEGHTAALALADTYIGAVYEMRPLKGGYFTVKKVNLFIDQAITDLNIEVWKAYHIGNKYELQGKITDIKVTTVANGKATKVLTDPLNLPMADDSSYIIHYLFLMDRSAGWQPLNNAVACGCDKQTILEKWLYQAGIKGNDKENLLYAQRKTGKANYINGIVLDIDAKCNDTGFICENYTRSPFLKTAIEHAVLYQAVSNLFKSFLRADVINRYTLQKREQMATDQVILHNKFKSRVEWISENLDLSTNNCFVCNVINEQSRAPYKAGIKF